MSMTSEADRWPKPLTDTAKQPIDSEGKFRNQILSQLVTTFQSIFPRTAGTFTLSAAATTVIAQPAITANSFVFPFPINASAATLMAGAKSLYQDRSANVAGASFTVKTADGTNAAGTEIFAYFVLNLV